MTSSTSGTETTGDAQGSNWTTEPAGSSSTTPSEATSSPSGEDGSSSSSDGASEACVVETTSLCDTQAAIIRASVRLPPGSEPISGDLVFSLMHRRYGDPAQGGHPHAVRRVPGVTVVADEAFPFEIDMCDANATMWSEENCEFNLVVSLDLDGDNGVGPVTFAPDAGEPTAMAVFELSCRAAGPTCLDVELSCVEGPSCIAFEAPGACECAVDSCDSEAAICQL